MADFVPFKGGAYLTAVQHGRKRVFKAQAGRGVKALNPKSRGVYDSIDFAGGKLVARFEHSAQAAEIVRLEGSTATPLSRFNAERGQKLDWQPFEEFWFTSAKGRKIHNWVVLPPGYNPQAKYPLVHFIHGGPHSSSLDKGHVRWSAQLLASGGYLVLLTDYTGSTGYGVDFARAIQGDPLKTPGEELHQAVEEAIARYPAIDGTRVAASGASYGGHLVNWLEATSDRFKCLVGHAGLVSLEGQWSTSDAVYHREINHGGPPGWAAPSGKSRALPLTRAISRLRSC